MSNRPTDFTLEDARSISDPVLITHLLVDLISSHRRGQIKEAPYQKGFDVLNRRLLDGPDGSPE